MYLCVLHIRLNNSFYWLLSYILRLLHFMLKDHFSYCSLKVMNCVCNSVNVYIYLSSMDKYKFISANFCIATSVAKTTWCQCKITTSLPSDSAQKYINQVFYSWINFFGHTYKVLTSQYEIHEFFITLTLKKSA